MTGSRALSLAAGLAAVLALAAASVGAGGLDRGAAAAMAVAFALGLCAGRVSFRSQRRATSGRRAAPLTAPPAPGATVATGATGATVAEVPAPPSASVACSDLEGLATAVAAIASALNEPRVLQVTLRHTRALLRAERATLHLHDRKTDRPLPGPTAVAPEGPEAATDAVSLPEARPDRNEALVRAALRQRRMLDRSDAGEGSADAFAAADPTVDFAIPLFDRAFGAGVLLVHRPALERCLARRAAAILASTCGLALSCARLSRHSEDQARLDPLTGLPGLTFIRQHLEERLQEGPVSILLIGADDIVAVNQTYGRRFGDKAIHALARLVSLETGADGIVGRYGGATLLVALPGRREDFARSLAERLLRRVPASVTAGPEGLARPLTISVGAAGGHRGPAEVLLQSAEVALAEAASGGGNRVIGGALDAGAKSHAQR